MGNNNIPVDCVMGDILLFKTSFAALSQKSPNAINNEKRTSLLILPTVGYNTRAKNSRIFSVNFREVDNFIGLEPDAPVKAKNLGAYERYAIIRDATKAEPLKIVSTVNAEWAQSRKPIPLNVPQKMTFRHAPDNFRLNNITAKAYKFCLAR